MQSSFQHSTIEALLLASPDPLPARKIADVLDGFSPAKVGRAIADLNTRYMESGCSFRIREIAGGYQIYIVPEFTGFVEELFARRRKMRLTRAALETLAIIAYRQPVTRVEIEQIRGVASDGVIHNLLEKSMITIRGRAEGVGKPLQYGTTSEFLMFFGLNSIGDLPKMSEIEQMVAEEEPDINDETDDLEEGNGNGNGNGHGTREAKLNIADGTFDPARRISAEDLADEPDNVPEIATDSDEQDIEPGESEQVLSDGADAGIIIDIDTT